MIRWICLLFLFNLPALSARDISLVFRGAGASVPIDRVEVVNLHNGTTLTLSGLDILNLKVVADSLADALNPERPLTIRPNMQAGTCEIVLNLSQNGAVQVEVLNANASLLCKSNFHMKAGEHTLKVSGMQTGAHRIIVTTPNREHSHWVMSGNNSRNAKVSAEYLQGAGAVPLATYDMPLGKSISMPYRMGERLLLKASAGTLQSVTVVVPHIDGAVDFRFAPCRDADGNNYPVVSIGKQLWMGENLKTTRFNNGSPIELIVKESDWRENSSPAYCWYDNNDQLKDWYGALYNWPVIASGNICPDGWRVPTDADWYDFEVLIDSEIQIHTALGWRGSQGGASLKASSGWTGGQSGFNSFGFTALPAGRRGHSGHFNSEGQYAYWWTASDTKNGMEAWARYLLPNYDYFYRGSFNPNYGFSIRCIYVE